MKYLIVLILVGVAMLMAFLCLGAFAQLNPDFPVKALTGAESLFANMLPASLKDQAFSRGFVYMGLSVILSSVAAMMVANTRAETIRRPGATKEA